MECKTNSFAGELITAPWWVIAAVCVIGNLLIWLVIPEYIEVSRLSGNIDGELIGRYAAAQSTVSKIFNLAMVVFYIFSRFNNLLLHKQVN
ncbi:MAG: hypothetical protein A2X82_01415 [Geobacteraceae bacterium GWC2_55_20]|nr:MAG: hypothetical protein A2X82_01415 [Geobacteraceae bacterium GWC2_55_20]OGU23772.1 MAG: hypothetical protein A2X85_04350 [Geobacteraceae bacterium GWF2_54_21]HBA73170.1 hypothetical protein [Geobacter sp.]